MSEISSTDKEDQSSLSSMLFLAGPPGSGKTALGSRVCADLGLRFLDLADTLRRVGEAQDSESTLKQVIDQHAADVVELSWPLQMARGTFALCRRHGHLIALWAHPLDMQKR
ncbi:MAG: AAA family ATPase [Pirellulaceae bacterium]